MQHGISAGAFRRHYWPAYHAVARDNRFGRILFFGARHIQTIRPLLRGLLRMVAAEQAGLAAPRMSAALWDMFTGSARYGEIFIHAVDPRLLARFSKEVVLAAMEGTGRETRDPGDAWDIPRAFS